MYHHSCQKRVRYGDTDRMGYLYYGNYPMLYEIGRSEALRDLGITYRIIEDELKVLMPVASMESRYKKPIFYDELVTITTEIRELPTKVITFYHNIINEEDSLCHTASVKLTFVSSDTQKLVRAPEEIIQRLAPFFK